MADRIEKPILPNESDPTHLDTDEKFAPRSGPEIPIYNKVETVTDTDLSFASILKGTAANPLTNFEKKAAFINVEIDKFGMGKYQICIWFLCGFGYFLDLAWSQGVGLIATAVYQEMNVPDGSTGDIWACANAGLAIGALTFGLLVDVIGRRWAFNLTCLITSVFGLLLVRTMYASVQHSANLGASHYRLLPRTIMAQFAASTSSPHLVLEATFPSTLPLPLNLFRRIVDFLSPFLPCGSPLASLLRLA